jgi:hypothetical protein
LFLVKSRKNGFRGCEEATVDSMEVAMETKSDRFHAGRNDESRNAKETIIVNQPGNNTTTPRQPQQKERLE